MNGLPIEWPLKRRAGTKKPRDFRAWKVTAETSRGEIKTRKKNTKVSENTKAWRSNTPRAQPASLTSHKERSNLTLTKDHRRTTHGETRLAVAEATTGTLLKDLKPFCGKRDAFDCAGIRSRFSWLPVDYTNRKIRARILAQSKASLFSRKNFKFFKFEFICIIAI